MKERGNLQPAWDSEVPCFTTNSIFPSCWVAASRLPTPGLDESRDGIVWVLVLLAVTYLRCRDTSRVTYRTTNQQAFALESYWSPMTMPQIQEGLLLRLNIRNDRGNPPAPIPSLFALSAVAHTYLHTRTPTNLDTMLPSCPSAMLSACPVCPPQRYRDGDPVAARKGLRHNYPSMLFLFVFSLATSEIRAARTRRGRSFASRRKTL